MFQNSFSDVTPSGSLTDKKENQGTVFSSMDVSDEQLPVMND